MIREENIIMRSDRVKKGLQQAPHRALWNALGVTKEEMNKPLVAVVSSWNEIVPGHMNLDKIAEAVKLGVAEAGGFPVVIPAIAVCDGIAMGHTGMKYSLVTRDLIADSTEAMIQAGLHPELRQERPGPSDGRGPSQYPDRLRQRRPDARRPCRRTQNVTVQHF